MTNITPLVPELGFKSRETQVTVEARDLAPLATAFAKNKTPKEIILDHWRLGAPALRALVDALLESASLQEIYFRGNKLTSESMDEICRLVSNGETRILDFTDNAMSDEHIGKLCVALRQAKGLLKRLHLSHKNVSDVGAKLLAKFLMTNSSLEDLILNEHCISDEGCQALGKALKTNTSLKWLWLQTSLRQVPSCRDIKDLIDGVKENRFLTQLNLPHSEAWPGYLTKRLDVYLQRNKVLTPLLKADLPLGIWSRVFQRANASYPDMLSALVKEKCDLFRSLPITQKRPKASPYSLLRSKGEDRQSSYLPFRRVWRYSHLRIQCL